MATENESDTPIEDKNKPNGNLLNDMIWATAYIALAAYGSSSFIYMLHISNEEIRKFKQTDKDIRENGSEFSVLSGAYMYGPPYFPNDKNTINFNPNDPASKKSQQNPKDFSETENTKFKIDEQQEAINIAYTDNLSTSMFLNNALNKNCPKKLDKFGKPHKKGKYAPKSKSDTLHDWLYSNSTFCDPRNLKSNVYGSDGNSWTDITKRAVDKIIISILDSFTGNSNPENLNDNQIAYRERLGYNVYKYIFFIMIGIMAFVRNIMNIVLKYISFDNNEYEYWDKSYGTKNKNPFLRKPMEKGGNIDYDKIVTNERFISRLQTLIVLIFAFLHKTIFSLSVTAGLFIGGIGSIVFALYKYNFLTMTKWWNASVKLYEQPVMWLLFSFVSLLFFILAIYLMFIIPGFVGQIFAFIVPIVIIGTIFVYPFYDKTEVYVKNNKTGIEYFKGNFVKSKLRKSPVEYKSALLKNNQCVSIPPVPGMPGFEPKVLENVQQGPSESAPESDRYTFIGEDGNPNPANLISDKKCYDKFIQKLSGKEYIDHLIGKNKSLWYTLFIHQLVRYIDLDTNIHNIGGQDITLVGSPEDTLSINMGTVPLLLVLFNKFITVVRNK